MTGIALASAAPEKAFVLEAGSSCEAEIVDAAGLAGLPAIQWDRLCAHALEDNPFLSRAVVLAGMEALGNGRGLRALIMRRNGELAGLLPFRVFGIGAVRIGRPALNVYQVGGAPLIARDHAESAVSTLAGLMDEGRVLPRRWVFPHVALEGAFMAAFSRAAREIGWETGVAARYCRPVLTRGAGDFFAHQETVIGKKRVKDIARNLRRLGEIGEVAFERVSAPEQVAARVEAFMRLEHRGWKGRRGTAFLSRPDHADFARKAFGGADAVADSLLLDGEPIAVSLNIGSGSVLFAPKCAFDENFRKYGPGMALEYKVIEAFFTDLRFSEMDAATTVDDHVIAGLWDGMREMGTVVAGPSGILTRGLHAGVSGFARAKARIKRVLGRG